MKQLWISFYGLICLKSVHICHSEFDLALQEKDDDASKSCSRGWFAYGTMCYRMGGRRRIGRLSWEKAADRCRDEYQGTLASIHSKELQDFITTFLLLSARANVWIGMHDKSNESTYEWTDDSIVDYTYWEPFEPSGHSLEHEDCTEMLFRSFKNEGKTGMWNDISCHVEQQYICQKEKEKQAGQSSDPKFCSSRIGGGWSFEKSCFHLVPEKKMWEEAEGHCKEKFKGHLVTIPDYAVNLFLDYIFRNQKENMWIGIKIKDEFQQQWSSGWYVAFENWLSKEKFSDGFCAIRDIDGKWSSRPCLKKLPFVCEYSTTTPPALKSPVIQGTHCPEGLEEWRDLGGEHCYYINTKESLTWHKAHYVCMRRGGTLLSIHSMEEVRMLHNFIRYTQYVIYIGLFRRMVDDEEFAWADESTVDFTFWEQNEPNKETEQCVEMKAETMQWNDVDCDNPRGFICTVSKVSTNLTTDLQRFSCSVSMGMTVNTLLGIIFCVIFVTLLLGIVIYYFRPCETLSDKMRKTSSTDRLETPPTALKKPKNRSEIVVVEDPYENVT